MRRRTALKYMGALASAAASGRLLSGCAGKDPHVEQGLTTLVVVCMENRSYDSYLGARALVEGKGGDGLKATMSNPDQDGHPVTVFHTKLPCIADPPHGWDDGRAQLNGGKNDGFVTRYQGLMGMSMPGEVMGYMTRAELPVTYALADAGTSCDRWFCSLLGPTWPNRMYLHSAQSGGLTANKLPGAQGFDWPVIYDRLNAAGIPWAYYFSNVPFVPLWKHLDTAGKVHAFDTSFFDDAAAGTLPPVVFIDPAFDANDDHPPLPPVFGQQFIASIYAALAASPQWPNVTLVVTYDEHGGFFDHVVPPTAPDDRAADGFGQLGFRVPTLIAGPYVKPGYVSSTVYDHTSVLAHIEKMFKLKPLTARDAAANDLSDAIDMERLQARDPLPPVKLPEVMVDESLLASACQHHAQASDIIKLAESGYFPPQFDRRARNRDILYAIGDQLARLGAGGIRRGH